MESTIYEIKTVGDLIAELQNYDKDMPVLKADLSPSFWRRKKIKILSIISLNIDDNSDILLDKENYVNN